MEYLWKMERKGVSLIYEYLLLTTIHLNWFLIPIIFIPLKINRGINDIPLSIICILGHNDDDWASLWIRQSTKGRNGNWRNPVIINSLNVDMTVWRRIDASNILTSNTSIINPVNQWLEMCEVVGLHVDKWSVNLTMQFSINSEIFHTLCRIWIGVRE